MKEKNLYTIVPLLYEGFLSRIENAHSSPLFIIPCENFHNNSKWLQNEICLYAKIVQNSDFERKLNDSNIFFCNSVVDRICLKPQISRDKTEVISKTESYYEWIIDTSEIDTRYSIILQELLATEFNSGIKFENSGPKFMAFEDRKFWLINGIHYYIAVLAYERGISYLHNALNNPIILQSVRKLQTEYINSFLEKHKIFSNTPPFNKESLEQLNTNFLSRVISNKQDTPIRVLSDLLSFEKMGDIDLNKLKLLQKISKDDIESHPEKYKSEIDNLLSAITNRFSSETSFFVKINERIIDPIIWGDIKKSETGGNFLLLLLRIMAQIMEDAKKKMILD